MVFVPTDNGPDEVRPLHGEALELWQEYAPQLGKLHLPLLREVCRQMLRLNRLDGLVNGRARRGEWLHLVEGDHGEMRVQVDDVLGEARQHATSLRGLVAELDRVLQRVRKSKEDGPQPAPAAAPAGRKAIDIGERIARRRAAAGGAAAR